MGNTNVCAVILDAEKNCSGLVKMLGADKIYLAEHPKLAQYTNEDYTEVISRMVKQYQPEMLFIGATSIGSELAPSVAIQVDTGLAAHCVDLRYDGNRINCMVPAFGGRVVSEIYIPEKRPIMASIRPGILPINEKVLINTSVEVVKFDASFLNKRESREEFLSFEPSKQEANSLTDADVVLCAGRGVNSHKAWVDLQKLASRLGAAIGYTRSFADLGMVKDERNMIGTSGKSVAPKLYMGFGISGATHHTSGMTKSQTVITINKDPHANMFNYADYGAVADADEVICGLLKDIDKG